MVSISLTVICWWHVRKTTIFTWATSHCVFALGLQATGRTIPRLRPQARNSAGSACHRPGSSWQAGLSHHSGRTFRGMDQANGGSQRRYRPVQPKQGRRQDEREILRSRYLRRGECARCLAKKRSGRHERVIQRFCSEAWSCSVAHQFAMIWAGSAAVAEGYSGTDAQLRTSLASGSGLPPGPPRRAASSR